MRSSLRVRNNTSTVRPLAADSSPVITSVPSDSSATPDNHTKCPCTEGSPRSESNTDSVGGASSSVMAPTGSVAGVAARSGVTASSNISSCSSRVSSSTVTVTVCCSGAAPSPSGPKLSDASTAV